MGKKAIFIIKFLIVLFNFRIKTFNMADETMDCDVGTITNTQLNKWMVCFKSYVHYSRKISITYKNTVKSLKVKSL